MAKKLYVGNLSFQTTEDELHNTFEQFGEVVEARVVTDRESGRSRGFGFVEMADDEGAEAAIGAMDGADLGGRRLRVSEARPRQEGGGRRGGRSYDRDDGGYGRSE